MEKYKKWQISFFFAVIQFIAAGCLNQVLPGMQKENLVPSVVTPARVACLARGINIHEWFFYPRQYPKKRLSHDDFELIRELGFTYIRLPVEFEYIYDAENNSLINYDHLNEIDYAIEQTLSHGLNISVDIHSMSREGSDKGWYSDRLEKSQASINLFMRFWAKFATHLSSFDPERLFIEPLNEPRFMENPAKWYNIQEQLVAIIRTCAPRHTIIATSTYWSNPFTFIEMQPLNDPNIIYNFHFYEPGFFVNQGITWGDPVFQKLHNIPYPSDPEVIKANIPDMSDLLQEAWLRLYGEQCWNRDRVEKTIGEAAAWGEKHHVPVICDEFGIPRQHKVNLDRLRWLSDVRTAFDAFHIGWALWNYDDYFNDTCGLVEHRNKTIVVDAYMARALNLDGYSFTGLEPFLNLPNSAATPNPLPLQQNSVKMQETLGKIQQVPDGGFSFRVPDGIETRINAAQATLVNETELGLVFLINIPGKFGQTARRTLDALLERMKNIERFQTEQAWNMDIQGKKGLQTRGRGRISGDRIKMEIVVVSRGFSFFLAIGFSFDKDSTVDAGEMFGIFQPIVESIEFFKPGRGKEKY